MTDRQLVGRVAETVAERPGTGPGRLRSIIGISAAEAQKAIATAAALQLIQETDPGPRGGSRYTPGPRLTRWHCSKCGHVHICETDATHTPLLPDSHKKSG